MRLPVHLYVAYAKHNETGCRGCCHELLLLLLYIPYDTHAQQAVAMWELAWQGVCNCRKVCMCWCIPVGGNCRQLFISWCIALD